MMARTSASVFPALARTERTLEPQSVSRLPVSLPLPSPVFAGLAGPGPAREEGEKEEAPFQQHFQGARRGPGATRSRDWRE